jgi:hypothetical protein
MATSDFFADSYAEARSKFAEACRNLGAALTEHALPNFSGPNEQTLSVDVARVGAVPPKSLLILISGTHGVEGFSGSGFQVGYLADKVHEALPAGAGVLLIHALNPFGFAWLRRVNENNVDLNRNFQDFIRFFHRLRVMKLFTNIWFHCIGRAMSERRLKSPSNNTLWPRD